MAEQSHKTEMAAAVRGDFERLRRRRGDTVTLDVPSPPPETAEAPPDTGPGDHRKRSRCSAACSADSRSGDG